MDEGWFEQLKRRVRFGPDDVLNVRSMAATLVPLIPQVSDRFHRWLVEDASARAVFTGGQPQLEAQRRAFAAWLADLVEGAYDAAYFRRRIEIGRTHVRVGLPQHHMFTAMEIVWQELSGVVRAAGLPESESRLGSLHKLLSLETAVMLESYKERYSERVREEERTFAEERLTRAEHLAQIGQLAASLAHEIKNPLAGISGAIQVIRDGLPEDDSRQPVIREILSQIDRLDATVKDLLVYARPRPPEFRPLDLAAVVSRVLKLMGDAAVMRQVRVQVRNEPDVPPIPADTRQIEQLIMNLLFNAAHASRPGSAIEVAVSSRDRRVRMEVRDRGQGMTPEVCARAFEPFFTTRAKGTGLGLPICRKIVDAHGGTIELSSRPGVGTTVAVELPAVWGLE